MNMKKLIALVLSIIMCTSALVSIFALPAFADEETETATETDTAAGEDAAEEEEEGSTSSATSLSVDYTETTYASMDAKITAELEAGTMELAYEEYGYELYYQKETGEVIIREKESGYTLSTNPYDIADAGNKVDERPELLSQLLVTYIDNGEENTMTSYEDAAELKQIKMSKIRGGIRVEYTIGKSSTKRTIPFLIEKARFEEMILNPIREKFGEDHDTYKKFTSYYVLKDPDSKSLTASERETLYNTIPSTRTLGAVYQLEESVANVERELNMFEGWIEENTKYTYDDVLYDHERTGYEGATKTPAVFRMALEYYVAKHGLEVRLPASGIRYDSSLYTLKDIQILPYFGACNKAQKGYAFIPDGSGTLVRFEDSSESSATTITSSLYSEDYAFYTQSIVPNMQPWVLPVFGMVENTEVTETQTVITEQGTVEDIITTTVEPKGFFAIITEGDSMLSISTSCGGLLNKYFSAFAIAKPRPTDTYPLDGVSVSGNTATWTVESDKKYTGSYRIKYYMLQGEEEATYVNMAKIYREYLEENSVLTEKNDTGSNIELFLETFGVIDATERRLGVPVKVQKDLTSFDNAKLMIDELSGYGINNLSLKYRGWANGGLNATAPTRVKVEKTVGGKSGMEEFVKYAGENNVKVYPDFDFTYVSNYSSGDKFNPKKDTVKTIDGRSAVHRTYSPIFQTFMDDGQLIISPNKILGFWQNLEKDFSKLGTGAVSLATLGSELNSDHNEDSSLNREDTKERIREMLAEVKENGYDVLLEQGNAYALEYADSIVNVPLDSSNRYVASEAIPFIGMVLHGYKGFSGDAINLAGDYTYNVLKTIENGADPYFILSYQNANYLKTSETYSKYYSIRYDIWKSDLIETYQILDMVLAPVKASKIDNHEFPDENNMRRVLVTYDNGVTFDIDYSTSVLIVNDGEREYLVDFDPELVEDGQITYAETEVNDIDYQIIVESGESATIVVENGSAYTVEAFLDKNGYTTYNAEN